MTESPDRFEQLLDNFSRLEEDRRWVIVDELERELERNPEKIPPHFERLLEVYQTAGGVIQSRLKEFICDVVTDHPDLSYRVVEKFAEQSTSTDEDTKDLVFRAARITERDQPEDLWEVLSESHIEARLEGSQEDRAEAYELLGAIGGTESVELLFDRIDNEVGAAKQAADDAVEAIAEQACNELKTEPRTEGSARTVQRLAERRPSLLAGQSDLFYRCVLKEPGAVAEAAADTLVRIAEMETASTGLGVWKLLDELDSTDNQELGRILGAVAVEESDEFESAIEAIVDRLETAESEEARLPLLAALVTAGSLHDDGPFPEIDRILETGADFDGTSEMYYIDLLAQIAESANNPGRLIPELVAALQNESTDTRKVAARRLLSLSIYPPPDALKASEKDPDPDIQHLVENAASQSPPVYHLPLEFDSEQDSHLLGMDASLKYLTRPGRWDPVSVDEYHRIMLEKVALAYQTGMGGNILLPYYRPRAGLLVPVEVAMQSATESQSSRTVLYSPGTSNHWGTYSDLRDAFQKYGLGRDATVSGAALPLGEWFTVSRFNDGKITPYTSGRSGSEIILTKSLGALSHVDNIDAVVCNFQARTTAPAEDTLKKIRSSVPNAPVFAQYSFLTKNQYGYGWPAYGYPDQEETSLPPVISRFPISAINGITELDRDRESATPVGRARQEFARLGRVRSITIQQLGGGQLTDALGDLYGQYRDVDEPETEDLASTIRSRLFGVHRLPVPVNIYNRWVRQQAISRGRYAPDTTQQLLHSLDQMSENYDLAYVPATVEAAHEKLEQLYTQLESSNPKFTYLVEKIEETAHGDQEVAILFLSNGMLEVFEFGIRERTEFDPDQLPAQGVHLSRPDHLRGLDSVDQLVLVADVPSALANFYLAPNADEIEILMYGTGMESLVSDWIDKQVDRIHDQLELPEDVDWPHRPQVSHEQQVPDIEAEPPEEETQIADIAGVQGTSETVLDGFTDGSTGGGGPSGEQESWPVEITTTGGSKVQLESTRSVFLHNDQQSKPDLSYIPISAGELAEGDTFAVIPESTRREFYRETLQELYEEEMSELRTIESLETWWETMRDIYREHESIDIIYSLLDRNGFEKSKSALRDWFRAVNAASKPIELVEYPELTIGPDSASDILLIGETFDRDVFVDNAGVIQNVMERFRQENRDHGRELNKRIIEKVEDPASDLASEVVIHEVESIDHQLGD
jgi:hypothetical protein